MDSQSTIGLRNFFFYVALLTLGGVFAVFLWVGWAVRLPTRPEPAPFIYVDGLIEAVNSPICSGNQLQVRVVGIVNRNDETGDIVLFWAIENSEGVTIYRPTFSQSLVWPSRILVADEQFDLLYTTQFLPELEPGKYFYRHSTRLWLSKGDTFVVPFEVKDCRE